MSITNKIIPLYDESRRMFFANSSKLPKCDIVLAGKAYKTGPLAFSVSIDLFGLSLDKHLVEKGIVHISDVIETPVVLENVYFTVGNQICRLSTKDLPDAVSRLVEGDFHQSIMLTVPELIVDRATVDVKGKPLAILDEVGVDSISIYLSVVVAVHTESMMVSVTGTIDQNPEQNFDADVTPFGFDLDVKRKTIIKD